MVLDHLGEDVDLRVEVLVPGAHLLDLGDELLRGVVLDLGLVVRVRVVGRLEEGGIEDLFLDERVDLERAADVVGELRLAFLLARLLELGEPLLDLPVVGLEEGDRILCRRSPALAPGAFRASRRTFHVRPP